MASTTALFGQESLGLTRLASGVWLRDAVAAEPLAWLGEAHLRRYGADPALLVKLLDAGQRLPVHAHPDREFARRHLDCPYGKTEAWVILEAPDDAVVHLGFARDVDAEQLAGWVRDQDGAAMLAAMHAVPVRPGDGVLVLAGLPHAIGAGVFLAELQEPSDFSMLMEWKPYGLDGGRDCSLGLDFEVALACVNRAAVGGAELDALIERETSSGPRPRLLPVASAPFFRAERFDGAAGPIALDPGFSVLIGLRGRGQLQTEEGATFELRRGTTVVVPYGAGQTRVTEDVSVLRCRPPAP